MSQITASSIFRVNYHRRDWKRAATRKSFASLRRAQKYIAMLKTTPNVSPLDVCYIERGSILWDQRHVTPCGGQEVNDLNEEEPVRAPRRPVGSTPENAVTDDMFLPDWEEIG